MYTDLILFDFEDKTFGFSSFIKIEIIKAASPLDLEKKINRSKQKIVVAEGSELNRLILENKKVDILTGAEKSKKSDFLHYRNSGLNQVLCKLANKNNIAIAFNFNDVLIAKGTERARIMGRMMQNARLCRKYNVKMIIASFASNKFELKNANDLISFGTVIGMTPKEAKESLMNIELLMADKKSRVHEGVKIVD